MPASGPQVARPLQGPRATFCHCRTYWLTESMEEAEHIERRLAAILSADLLGYHRMMGEEPTAR